MAKTFGAWVFIIGLIIAVLLSVFSVVSATEIPEWSIWLLMVIGLIVGLLNVTEKEVKSFLIASIAFLISFQVLAEMIEQLTFNWKAVSAIFRLINVFLAPAAAIVALNVIYKITKD